MFKSLFISFSKFFFACCLEHLRGFLKIDARRAERQAAEEKMAAPDFWDNKEKAQDTVARLSSCRNVLVPFARCRNNLAVYECGGIFYVGTLYDSRTRAQRQSAREKAVFLKRILTPM